MAATSPSEPTLSQGRRRSRPRGSQACNLDQSWPGNSKAVTGRLSLTGSGGGRSIAWRWDLPGLSDGPTERALQCRKATCRHNGMPGRFVSVAVHASLAS